MVRLLAYSIVFVILDFFVKHDKQNKTNKKKINRINDFWKVKKSIKKCSCKELKVEGVVLHCVDDMYLFGCVVQLLCGWSVRER